MDDGWNPVGFSPKIQPPDDWAVVNHVPTGVSLADAWDVNGPAISNSLSGAYAAAQDPTFWTDAAHQYANAMIAGTSGPSARAALIAGYAKKLGYNVDAGASAISRSNYLNLSHDSLPDGIKVRVSDHDLPPSYGPPGDYDVHSGDPRAESIDWTQAVRALANRVGMPTPPNVAGQITRSENAATALQNRLESGKIDFEANRPRTPIDGQIELLSSAFPGRAAGMARNAPGANQIRAEAAAEYEKMHPGEVDWVQSIAPSGKP